MKLTKLTLAVTVAAAVGAAPMAAQAHHSHAMFDPNKIVEIQGTVKTFNFANPHVYLFLINTNNGSEMTYPIEMSFIQNMMRQGMTVSTFKPGDKVTVAVNPYRSGQPGGSYRGAIDARGRKFGSLNPETAQQQRAE